MRRFTTIARTVCSRSSRSAFSSSRSVFTATAPLAIVLDLDETLVRVFCDGAHNKSRRIDRADFTVPVSVGTSYNCGVSYRPGLEDFFDWIKDRRRNGMIEGPWLFTTSTAVYTQAILTQLDPNAEVFDRRHILAREACSPSKLPGFLLKDLSRQVPLEEQKGEDLPLRERRKVLLDNNPVSHVLNPECSVLCHDWLGKLPSDDCELRRMQDLIDEIIFDARVDPEFLDGERIDYVASLARCTPGHDSFKDHLQRLRKILDTEVPRNRDLLRKAFKDVQDQCHTMKLEHLGLLSP